MHGLQAQRRADPLTGSGGVYLLLVSAAALVVALDQASKEIALRALAPGPVVILGGLITLRLTFNPGGAFGLLPGLPGFFLLATVVVVVGILAWARRVRDGGLAIALGLVLGGGLGNLADRVLRDHEGRVVDFIDLRFWPVFNLADSAIVVGVGLILLLGSRREA